MNEESKLLYETSLRLFERHADESAVRAAERGEGDGGLLEAFVEAGLDEVLVAMATDAGAPALPAGCIVARAAGQFAAPLPLVETMLARWLEHESGASRADAAVAVVDCAPVASARPPLTLHDVPWGRTARTILAVAGDGDSPARLLAIDATQCEIVPGENLAGEPRDTVKVTASAIGDPLPLRRPASSFAAWAATLRAAQIAGAMDRALGLALTHAGERVQFGRPIAAFQAVQQMLAECATHVAAAAAAVELGADVAAGGDATLGASIAKGRASDAVRLVADISHQVIAAMGYSREHALQLYTRRLWAWRDEYGSEHRWYERLGGIVLEKSRGGLWTWLTASTSALAPADDA